MNKCPKCKKFTLVTHVGDLLFEDNCIKRMSCGHGNFYYQRFNWIEASSDHEAMERLGEMLDNKASYPMEDAIAQDGMLDDCEIFLVFEKSDLEKLIMKLFLALKDAY